MQNRTALPAQALDQLFTTARTANSWDGRPVDDADLHAIWDLAKFGPTSANCLPARVVWVKSPEAKERLGPALSKGNLAKTMAAPVTGIIAYDLEFYETLPETFPHTDAKSWFTGNEALIQETAFRNGSLQGAYVILAARSLGFDCGPMSGFDAAKVDAAFFPEGRIKTNFLLNLGHSDGATPYPRLPRLSFERACKIL